MAKYRVNCVGCWKNPLVRCSNCRRTNFTKEFKSDGVQLTCKRCGYNVSSYTHYCKKNSILARYGEASTNTNFSKKNLSRSWRFFYIVIFIIFALFLENI